MSIKQMVKPLVPESLLTYRRDLIFSKMIDEHKKMSQAEVESWLKGEYRKNIGAELHLDKPRRYTEKIQWLKLNAMDEKKSLLADKHAVRRWVAETIGKQYLIPLVGVWDSPDDIDFDALPGAFVLKTTQASGTNIVVPDKRKLNVRRAKKLLERWLALDYGWVGFDRHYMRITPRIIGEEFVSNADGSEAFDYKFHCFGGKPYYVRIDIDRHSKTHCRATFDMEWSLQDWCEGDYARPEVLPERPACFEELKDIVSKLADGLGHARVDFYVIDGRPLFGEMTMSSGGGFERIRPDAWDYKLGELWDLSMEPRVDFPYGKK